MQDNSPVFNFITHNNAKAHLWRGWGKLNILLILLLFNLCEKYTMIENRQKCSNKCIWIFAPKIAKIALIDSIANFCAKIRIVFFRKYMTFGAKFEIIFGKIQIFLPNLTFKLWKEILVLLTLKKRKNYLKFTQPCSCFFEGFRFGWISPWHFGSQLCGAKCVFQHWPISRRWPVCQKLENLARYFFRLSRDPSIK